MARRRARSGAVVIALAAVVAGLVAPVAGVPAATAAAGSLVSGAVWADADRDGVRDGDEAAKAGVTVQLLSSPGGAVVATTTTGASGVYGFSDVPDGDYTVRVDAPGPFRFPATASGDNDVARAGDPPPGEPERGLTAPLTIAGASQVTGLDAGMRPIADLSVERLPVPAGCEGLAVTGTPPFDASDDPGEDSGPGNCVVRVGDTVSQNYSVALTGLPTGAEVPDVVAEFTLSSPDGGILELAGPGTDGLPAGCLAAANGADPPSSRTVNPDGSVTVVCNLGTMSSNVAAVQIAYRFSSDTPIPSHAGIEMHAFAAGGDAGASNTVDGPEVEVTGAAEWDLWKRIYPSGNIESGPNFTVYNGAEGYLVRYLLTITDMLGGTGGSDLVWPATFTDVMPEFPGARITQCRATQDADTGFTVSPWTLTCPLNEAQGADGWDLSIRPNSGHGSDTGVGRMVMTVFVPLAEMNRAIDPGWQPGDPAPTGIFDFDNRAQDTDHWSINGGALNYGSAEPGTGGTGNNLATLQGDAEDAQWDLVKSFHSGPELQTRNVGPGGAAVDGVDVVYVMTIVDRAGPDNIAPWLDRPVEFDDRLVSHPDAVLVSCTPMQTGSPLRTTGDPTCGTNEVQPPGGWHMEFTPNQTGFDRRAGTFFVRIFIPLDQIEGDICESTVTLDLHNEVVNSDTWTVGGEPVNGSGLEPGWDGTTATGNNVDRRSIRPSATQCGSLTGNKVFIKNGSNVNDQPTFGGDIVTSFVSLNANNSRVVVDDLQLCDVFDVSVFRLVDGTPRMGSFPSANNVDPADFVIEYAAGPNEVDTQAGPRDATSGLYPIDASSIEEAAAGCRDDADTDWSTDPEADFGAGWQDRVNMVRVRPIDPGHVETGPFDAHLFFELEARTFYNGGPDEGTAIPTGVRLTNIGGWPTGMTGDSWSTARRELRFTGMLLTVGKTVTPTLYLPGDEVQWNLNVGVGRATVGATLRDLQIVDTIPEGLHFDPECTADLLPPGVTVSYNAAARQATFRAGDIELTTAPTHSVFHQSNGAPRLRICTTVDSLAQPGDPYVNTVRATAANAENQPTADATITVVGSGQLGISKQVDRPFVASGEEYTWSLDWGNTSTVLVFQAPDVIDVLPWVGDGADDALSGRDQFASDYEGLAQLTGPLAAPTYVRGGGGGAVPGAWYYSTAGPSTIDHDARAAANANPQAAGGVWLTEAEVGDFGAVTAVRFVSGEPLPVQSRVRAFIPAVATSDELDNLYVNRAMIFSGTFANQPLLSNEPYVQMPGFSIGDLVWLDNDGDGRFSPDVDEPMAGVAVEVRDAGGEVVGTATTDSDGRWSVTAIPAGTYTVHVPAAMFRPGGPLASYGAPSVGSSDSNDENEGVSNNNTDTPDPTVTGLTSSPVTLAYRYDDGGDLVGANGPEDEDVAGLAGELIAPEFTNFTVDLLVGPISRVDIEKATNGEDADVPTGPRVPAGDEVRWTYVVTNTGSTDLFDVTVTDDMIDAALIDCDGTGGNVIAGPLAPEDVVRCVAVGTAVTGQYANLGTVVATGPETVDENGNPVAGVVVDDADPSHYFGLLAIAMTGAQAGPGWAFATMSVLAGGVLLMASRRGRRDEERLRRGVTM